MMNGRARDGTQDDPRPTTLNRISVTWRLNTFEIASYACF